MPVEPLSEIAYVTGEAISEKVGEKLEKIPFWKKVRTYLVFIPILICVIWFIGINQGWI
ncbi:MAG: hypothetical protein ACJZ49_07655 [Candidatus Thalassarchaeaceae archaeon]|tara:strand:- start:504 stop:680 length:177 start_codon:yes stop_codon:yes gene_type:complete